MQEENSQQPGQSVVAACGWEQVMVSAREKAVSWWAAGCAMGEAAGGSKGSWQLRAAAVRVDACRAEVPMEEDGTWDAG